MVMLISRRFKTSMDSGNSRSSILHGYKHIIFSRGTEPSGQTSSEQKAEPGRDLRNIFESTTLRNWKQKLSGHKYI